MPVYFLDTSALVRRYVSETGMQWVRDLCDPATANIIIVSQLTQVEAVSAFCSKARDQNPRTGISPADRDQLISLFRQDLQRNYSVVDVTDNLCLRAADLCTHHKLKAYDAVQLSSALAVKDSLRQQGIDVTFVSADNNLLSAAAAESLLTDNPTNHP